MVWPAPSTLIDDTTGRGTPVGYTVTKPGLAEASTVTFNTTALAVGGTSVNVRVKVSPALTRCERPWLMRVSRIRYGGTGTYDDAPAGATACTTAAGATMHTLRHSAATMVETRATRR